MDILYKTTLRFWKVGRIQTGWGPQGLKNNTDWVPWVFLCPHLSQTGFWRSWQPRNAKVHRQKTKQNKQKWLKKICSFLTKDEERSGLARRKTCRQYPSYSSQRAETKWGAYTATSPVCNKVPQWSTSLHHSGIREGQVRTEFSKPTLSPSHPGSAHGDHGGEVFQCYPETRCLPPTSLVWGQ